MTTNEFNKKYKEYLEEEHYGLDIPYQSIIDYLDNMFKGLTKIPGFKYTQIKEKFGTARFYTNLYDIMGPLGSMIGNLIEKDIDFLLRVEDEVNKRLNK